MERINKEEILKALRLLQEVCESHICSECPLRMKHDKCYIAETPVLSWNIADESVWSAFKDSEVN